MEARALLFCATTVPCNPLPVTCAAGEELLGAGVIAEVGQGATVDLGHAAVVEAHELADLAAGLVFQNHAAQDEYFSGG